MTAHWDVIIVGAGAVGSAALRAASEAGARTLCIELHSPANLHGSSHGHSRIFRHAYFEHPDYVPLLRHSTARFESLERESGQRLLHRCGMLLAGAPDSVTVHGSLLSARRWALDVESLDARSLRERWPWLTAGDDAIGVFERDAGLVRPEAVVHAAISVALARGAEVRTTSRVLEVSEGAHGVSVTTAAGVEHATAVIIAGGPWSSLLMPELAPLLRVTRQVQAWMAPVATAPASMPCWLFDRGPGARPIYGLPPDPLAGTGSDGASGHSRYPKVALHGSEDLVDPDVGATPVNDTDVDRLRAAYRAVAPTLAGALVAAATCLYTMSPDGDFLLGTRRGCSRTHYAAGLSGHGFKLSPALGDALAGLALHGRTNLPVGFLAPDRFAT